MNRQVHVNSIAALRRFQAALREYAEAIQDILDNLQLESQRTVDWIQRDRMSYWPRQLKSAGEALTEAINRLEMKQLTLNGRDAPSCSEERNDVHRWRERLRYVEQQLGRTRQLGPVIQQHAEEYCGVLAKLSGLVEIELPRAIAALDRMATALEKYTTVAAPPRHEPAPPHEAER
jgi:hypothetical protein